MKINIANKLKKLRKEKRITQEELASYLGVSFQAVSRWERDEGYPDIELLPIIANYFETSVDELLGVNEVKSKLSLEKVYEKHHELASKGKIIEDISHLKESIILYPNEWELLILLAMLLINYGDSKEKEINNTEAIRLLVRVINNSKDLNKCLSAKSKLVFAYKSMNKMDLAIETAKELPDALFSYQYTLPSVLSGLSLIKECQSEITYLPWRFYYLINNIVKEEYYSNEEKIILWNKVIKFYELIYEEKDYAFSNLRIGSVYEEIGELYLKDNKILEAFNNLNKAIDYYSLFDTLKDEESFTSLLAKEMEYKKEKNIVNNSKSACKNLLNYILNSSIYDSYRENEEYIQAIKRLEDN